MLHVHPPLKETKQDYTTGADTFIPAFTRVRVLAERDDGMSLVNWEGTLSCFQIPLDMLREPYKEEVPVKPNEDPLESREFVNRCQLYRYAEAGTSSIRAWLEVQDFIRHHFFRRSK